MALINPPTKPLSLIPEETTFKDKIKQDLTSKGITTMGDYKPTEADVNEFKQTGSFSQSFYNNLKKNTITKNENKIFGSEVVDPGSSGPAPEVIGIDASGNSIYKNENGGGTTGDTTGGGLTGNTGLTGKGTIGTDVIGNNTGTTTTTDSSIGTNGTTTIGKIDGRDWELGQEELNIYNTLTDTQKKDFWVTRDQLSKNQTDYTKDLISYLTEAKKTKDYYEGQQDKKTQINTLTGEIEEIQSSQRIRDAEKKLQNIKQNLSYLGSMGMPGVSTAKIEAVQKQVSEADKTFGELKTIENNLKQIRELGLDIDTATYEKKMDELQTSLDNQVNTSIQNAFNSLLAADANGQLDTIEDIEKFKTEVLLKMDKEIEGVTDKNFQERKFLIDQANINIENAKKTIAENQKKFEEFKKNANTVNTDMSAAQGFYVDGNGNPIISATTGTTISIPEEAPMEPVFDKATGKLITFFTDENGQIQANVDQIIDQPTFEQNIITGVANAIKKGTLTLNQVREIYPGLEQNEQIVNALSNIQKETTSTQDWSKLSDGSLYNQRTGEIKQVGTGGTTATNVMRTDRNNNPTAMTTDVAKTLGLQEGVDYTQGDPFQTSTGTLYTAKFLGNPIDTTIKALDLSAESGDRKAFYTKSGGQRWTHTAMTDEEWLNLTPEQKSQVVSQMYQNEGGSGILNNNQPFKNTQDTGIGGYTQDEINKFKYSERLTPNEQNNYLKEQGLVDKYMQYNANRQETEGGLLEGISSIQDITFPEKTTEFKTKSYNYGTRMDEANKFLSQMDDKYKNSWTSTEYLAPRGEWVPNFLKTDDRQSFEQAQRNFINAVLRQESGAVISDQEFANAKKQYFPSAGDSEATLNQKKSNREMAIYNMLKSAGKDELGRDIGNIWKELNKGQTTGDKSDIIETKSSSGNVYKIKPKKQ